MNKPFKRPIIIITMPYILHMEINIRYQTMLVDLRHALNALLISLLRLYIPLQSLHISHIYSIFHTLRPYLLSRHFPALRYIPYLYGPIQKGHSLAPGLLSSEVSGKASRGSQNCRCRKCSGCCRKEMEAAESELCRVSYPLL